MRTIAGLIVGLALGILLMYFTVSTFKVKSLKESSPAPGRTPSARPATAPDPRPPSTLGVRLGEAAATALADAVGSPAIVLVLAGAEGTPFAADARNGFQKALATRTGITLVEAGTVATALERRTDAAALFCADHDQLRELCEQAGERPLPPLYSVGWSEWLLGACALGNTSLAGVAVVAPAAAARRLTPLAGPTALTATADEAIPLVVLPPADFAAAFALPQSSAATTPAAP